MVYVRSPEINMGVVMLPLGKVVVRDGAKLVRTRPTEPRPRTQSSGMLISLLRQASPIDYMPYGYELFKLRASITIQVL